MPKVRVREEGHWIRKRRGTWIIAVPPEVRSLLGVTHRARLYWHIGLRHEAVLATTATRAPGRPAARALARQLAQALAEVDAIKHRDALRDRSCYAEGFAHGYLQAYERLHSPGGPSAERAWRRRLWAFTFPEAAKMESPKQASPRPAPSKPRMNARTRRAKQLQTIAAPVLEGDPSPSLPPSDVPASGGDAALGGEAPQAAHYELQPHGA